MGDGGYKEGNDFRNESIAHIQRAKDGNSYRHHATGLPAGGDADQKFFEAKRKISPAFPSFDEAMAQRQRDRENLAGRFLMLFTVAFIVGAIFNHDHPLFYIIGAAVFGIGFVVFAFVAGARHDQPHIPKRGDYR